MNNEIKKLMRKNDFFLIRKKSHLIWQHENLGRIVTSRTPSCRNVINNITKDIKKRKMMHEKNI